MPAPKRHCSPPTAAAACRTRSCCVGPKGIGKATLAYRMARFVLAHPDPAAAEVQAATSLAVDAGHPVARRIAAQAQGDLLVLERTPNEKGRAAPADRRRRRAPHGFVLRLDGGRGRLARRHRRRGRRAQSVERQRAAQSAGGAAAARAAAPGRAIRRRACRRRCARAAASSRCGRWRRPMWRRPSPPRPAPRPTIRSFVAAAAAAEGCVARALALLDEDALALRQQALDAARRAAGARSPTRCMRSATRSPGPIRRRSRLCRYRQRLAVAAAGPRPDGEIGRLARLAEAWERINASARDAEIYNLERKPLVFSVFGLLAEATRG